MLRNCNHLLWKKQALTYDLLPTSRTPHIGSGESSNANPVTPAQRRGRNLMEFRRNSGALVIGQKRTVADVARSLGLNRQTLCSWVRRSARTVANESV